MAKADAPLFRFHFRGEHDGWFCLRAPLWDTVRRTGWDGFEFRHGVIAWLMAEAGRNRVDWHAGNGDAPGSPAMPVAFSTGSAFCVMLRSAETVTRFAGTFDVQDWPQAA